MLNDYYGLTYWFSIINKYTQYYVDLCNETSMEWRSFGFNNDLYTEALAGCRYYYSSKPQYGTEYMDAGEITFNNSTWYVYENPYYLGIAYTTDRTDSYNKEDGISLEEYNTGLYATISTEPLSNSSYDNARGIYTCQTNAVQDTNLVLAFPYSADWTAYVDGKKVLVGRSNMYLSIALPAGQHTVEFRYSRNLNYLCLALCSISLILLFLHNKRCSTGSA
jgi:uncharacterized membrane protein YfhO